MHASRTLVVVFFSTTLIMLRIQITSIGCRIGVRMECAGKKKQTKTTLFSRSTELTKGNASNPSELMELSSFLETGKFGGKKYRKQFLCRKEKAKPEFEIEIEGLEQSGCSSSQAALWTHRRIWASKSTVSWLLLGPVVSGSILTQSEVEGSATTTPSSCCVSGGWYSGDGGFISLTSSLPFSTLKTKKKGGGEGIHMFFSYISHIWNTVSFIRTCTHPSLRLLDYTTAASTGRSH